MEKPIRILQILTIMNRGGAESMIMNYYRNMDRSQVQFDFLLHREEKGYFEDEITALGGKIYKLQPINLKNYFSYQRQLHHFLVEHPYYKIIHCHLNALSTLVLGVAKKNNVPCRIAHSHTSLYNLNLNPFSKKRHTVSFAFKFFVQNIFKMGITKQATHYFTCGNKAGQWLFGKKNSAKLTIINNAIYTQDFTYNPVVATDKKKQLGVENTLVIGHVGNFVFEKNHPFLLHVFKAVKEKYPNSVLLLVGAGNSLPIQQLAKNLDIHQDVHFLGARNDVPELLQAFDIFLFP